MDGSPKSPEPHQDRSHLRGVEDYDVTPNGIRDPATDNEYTKGTSTGSDQISGQMLRNRLEVVAGKSPLNQSAASREREYSTHSSSSSISSDLQNYNKKLRRHRFSKWVPNAQSILDAHLSTDSGFTGFYTLFWTLTAVGVIRQFIYNYIETGGIMGNHITNLLLTDLIYVALTDLAMYLSTYCGFFVQLAVVKGYISWWRTGWWLQNLLQASIFFFFLWAAAAFNFPWIGRVFLVLHSLVFLMKLHSYGFYNGHFWTIKNELENSKALLADPKTEKADIPLLEDSVKFCEEEFALQSSDETFKFPDNITLSNYFWYTMFPTCVYQFEFPRTARIRWHYVFVKVAATFGVFFLMIFVAENYLYPIAIRAITLRDTPWQTKLRLYPLIFLDLIPPFVMMYLLVFYIIWDAILNAIAELSRFGDRNFYGDWWNCTTWDQFAKEWNVPVHKFLLRHVYHSSISSLHLSKGQATFFTFLLSSCVHELVMLVIFGKLRGYLLGLQMLQLPMMQISRMSFMKDRLILGNVIFWIGIITGPSIMCSLYLTF